MGEQWRYDTLRRRWEAAVPNPTEPMPAEVPYGTAYPDWPRCAWPAGCTLGVRSPRSLCSPHSELTLAYGHAPAPAAGALGTADWQRCATCGVRGAMHSRLQNVEEAAVMVWLEDYADVVLEPPPPSAHVERMQRVPDQVNLQHGVARPAAMLPMAAVQAALNSGVPEDQVAAHLAAKAAPAVPSPKVREDARPTSRQAAAKVAPAATTQRGRVLRVIVDAGEDGATDEQVRDRLGMSLNTVRPRRLELVEQGYVIDSGDTRETDSGAQAICWLATLDGIRAVEETNP